MNTQSSRHRNRLAKSLPKSTHVQTTPNHSNLTNVTGGPVHMKVYESHPFALYTIRGNIFFNFMGCTPMYTGIRVDSGTLLSAANPKKYHFSHFSLSPGAGIIILQPPKAAFCEGGTMAHQNLKRKWGVTIFAGLLLSELPRLELAKRGKNGIFGTNSNNYTHNIPRHPLGWTWNLKLTPLPIFLTNNPLKHFTEN